MEDGRGPDVPTFSSYPSVLFRFFGFCIFFKYKPIIFIIQIIILKIKNYLCRLLFQIVGLDFPTYLRGDKTIMLITIIFCSPL